MSELQIEKTKTITSNNCKQNKLKKVYGNHLKKFFRFIPLQKISSWWFKIGKLYKNKTNKNSIATEWYFFLILSSTFGMKTFLPSFMNSFVVNMFLFSKNTFTNTIRWPWPTYIQVTWKDKEQEGFHWCQTPTSTVRLKGVGCRVKNEWSRIGSDEWRM